tara:strand:+ start:9205 stop:9477 length:273 start_codon:yes stop_codon:yes gene_type:complete
MTSFTVFLIAISIIATIVLREVATWYWKINKIVSSLESIEEILLLGLDLEKSISIQHNSNNEKIRTVTIEKYLGMSTPVRDNYSIVNTKK